MQPHCTIPTATGSYPVLIGRGAAEELPRLAEGVTRGRRFAVASRRVLDLHAPLLEAALAGFEILALDDGEELKTLETAARLVDTLLERGARRDSLVAAVGGGMVGDTAGFAAAILLRGIPLIQVPTTLLAQVDSSIGGKTAVNHARGKNLIGAVWPPRAVVSDLRFLDTLPERELLSGLFEAMKGGILADARLFELTESSDPSKVIDEIVCRSVDLKAAVVAGDEREGDRRRLLNYGHTIGHGIEAALDYRGLTHGEAVGWGMIGANAIAVARGLLDRSVADRIAAAVLQKDPRRPGTIDAARVLGAMEADKKFTASRRVMALATGIGSAVVVEDVRVEELEAGVAAALAAGSARGRTS